MATEVGINAAGIVKATRMNGWMDVVDLGPTKPIYDLDNVGLDLNMPLYIYIYI